MLGRRRAASPHLKVRQLSKRLAAHVALVFDFSVLLFQRVRQRLVAHRAHAGLHLGEVYGLPIRPVLAGVAEEGRGRFGGDLVVGGRRAYRRGAAGWCVGWPVRVRVRVVMAGFFLQGGSGGEGTGGPRKEEVSAGRDGGGVDRVGKQEMPPWYVGRQEGHLGGQEATVEGVHPGEDSSNGGSIPR